VARAPGHRDRGHQRAARPEPGRETRRLGDDPAVGAQSGRRDGERPGAGGLLVGDCVDDEIAHERHLQRAQDLGGEQHARHAALHVARPASEHPAVAQRRHERIARPQLARLDAHHVDVPV
jgi:hypothetical protein